MNSLSPRIIGQRKSIDRFHSSGSDGRTVGHRKMDAQDRGCRPKRMNSHWGRASYEHPSPVCIQALNIFVKDRFSRFPARLQLCKGSAVPLRISSDSALPVLMVSHDLLPKENSRHDKPQISLWNTRIGWPQYVGSARVGAIFRVWSDSLRILKESGASAFPYLERPLSPKPRMPQPAFLRLLSRSAF